MGLGFSSSSLELSEELLLSPAFFLPAAKVFLAGDLPVTTAGLLASAVAGLLVTGFAGSSSLLELSESELLSFLAAALAAAVAGGLGPGLAGIFGDFAVGVFLFFTFAADSSELSELLSGFLAEAFGIPGFAEAADAGGLAAPLTRDFVGASSSELSVSELSDELEAFLAVAGFTGAAALGGVGFAEAAFKEAVTLAAMAAFLAGGFSSELEVFLASAGFT